MKPDLAEIFRCDDQSALVDNCVASIDPPPGAWSHHSATQSPLGQVSFLEMIGSEVVTIVQGQVITRAGRGRSAPTRPSELIEHALTSHEWLPWRYTGRGPQIDVVRTVARDQWVGRVRVRGRQPALLLLELRTSATPNVELERRPAGLRFRWNQQFVIDLSVAPAAAFDLSDEPGPLKRKFAGFADVQLNAAHGRWAWAGARRLWLGVVFRGQLDVGFQVRRTSGAPARAITLGAAQRAEEGRWRDFFGRQVRPLHTDDPVLRDVWTFGWQTLWSNRCHIPTGQLRQPFTSPTRLGYGAQWWFDEPFNSVAYRYLVDPGIAYIGLENFWRAQRPDGAIPGCVRFGPEPSTMGMQPPIIGLVLQLLKGNPGWPRRLAPIYTALLRHARWHLSRKRDTDQDGLAEYHHCFDGPADQSQRWDSQKFDPAKVIDQLRPTESVDMNVWLSLLWQVLSKMAAQLGDQRAAADHARRAQRTIDLIERLMWDERDGFYYDIDGRSHRKIRVKTPYGLMPLLSPLIQPDRVERLVREHLFNPREFWCRYPLPSVSLDHPTFDPVDMFRGPTWVNQNWLVVEGLERQGYHREAVRLARRTIDLVGPRYRAGRRVRSPRFWEWYHPHTGEPLGNPQYSWSAGLAVDLILRFLGGEQSWSGKK